MKQAVLISACLLGVRCRYDGACKGHRLAQALADRYQLIPVCAEQLGGLATPRVPAERVGSRVKTKDGRDVTREYALGAQEVLRLATLFDCKLAILKERSPSCGSGQIYDGSFTGRLIAANGVTAQRLQQNGVRVVGESQLEELLAIETAAATESEKAQS